MKWKLKPGQVISYRASIDEIDTANHKNLSFNGFSKSFGDDSLALHINNFYKGLNIDPQHQKFDIHLSEKRKNIIDVEMMSLKTKKEDVKLTDDTTEKGMDAMRMYMEKMSGGVMLRGSIYEDGTIESFYTVNTQKNLLAMFFELPAKAVSVGVSWPVDLHLISMDQSFICDTSYHKNSVNVVSVENKGGETIVTLKYDIIEYVEGSVNSPFNDGPTKTTMKMSYRAIAAFSVEKGRWTRYEGVMSEGRTGLISSQTTQKYTLVEE